MNESNTVQKIKNKKEMIREILINQPDTRDNDNLLILKVWAEQNPELRNRNFTFQDFAPDFINHGYVDAETVRRARQKLQEQDPETRGKKYESRHAEGDATRRDIHGA